MGSAARLLKTVRFADCTLDLQTAELCRNGETVILQDQSFQILTTLLETPGRLVTRAELIKKLWPDGTFVDFDHSLNKAVARLREALRDNAEHPQFVETLPRKGYRWIGASIVPDGIEENVEEVRENLSGPVSDAAVTKVRSAGRSARFYYMLVSSLALGFVLWWAIWQRIEMREREASSSPVRSIAVLPLENLLGDPAKEYLVDGLTDSLVADLARSTPIRVISRTSSMHYKGTHKTIPEIARELKVDAILEGSVSQFEGSLRINLQLIVTKTDSHLWARTYEGGARYVLGIQDQFVQDIAQQLTLHNSNTGAAAVARSPRAPVFHASQEVDRVSAKLNANQVESNDLYLHGLFYSNKLTKEGMEKGIAYFSKAVSTDQQNKLAYVGLAESYCNMADRGFASVKTSYASAKDAALKALALDEGLAEAHSILGWVIYACEWDSARAEREFLRAIELSPNYSAGHALYGEYLARHGRIAESEQQLTTAVHLDPLSLPVVTEMYMPYYLSRRYGLAIEASRRALEIDPNFEAARLQLIFLYELTGNIDAAVEERSRADVFKGIAPEVATEKARTLRREIARKGPSTYWEKRLKDSLERGSPNWPDPNDLIFIYLHLGRKEEAMDRLEKAVRDRDAEFDIQNDPEFEDLWGEPRFQKLVAEMKPAEK